MTKFRSIYLLLFIYLTSLYACGSDTQTETDDDTEDAGRGLASVEAKKYHDFINSIGINTHLGFDHTNYWLKWDEIALPRLKEIGIKHIRDGSIYVPKTEERVIELGKIGVKLLLIATENEPQNLTSKLTKLTPYLSGVESYNEADLFYDTRPDIWVPFIKNNQKAIYNLVKTNPEYSHLPIVGLSLANLDNGKYIGDISHMVDYGNIHSYPTAFHPINNWGYSMRWEEMVKKTKIIFGDKPLIATETGYHNYSQLNEGFAGVPENISAIYILHLLFKYFNKGIIRTYIYELLDTPPHANLDEKEHQFGLIRQDGSAKPAFYALKNLIALLNDKQHDFTPKPLAYKISSNEDAKNDVKHSLLQKSDGTWWIAIYRTSEIYDAKSHTQIPLAPIKVVLDLNYTASIVNLYIPNKSTDKQISFKKRDSLEFELGSELILAEVIY